MPKKYRVKDLNTGDEFEWTIKEVLHEINDQLGRSAEWTDYDESDWQEGWESWAEGDSYTMLNFKDV